MKKAGEQMELQVQLFGNEKITYNGTPILFSRNSMTKSLKLLLILLYYGREGIARKKLLECLYGREEYSDAANTFRVTLHRAKKMLSDAGLPEYDYIVVKDGKYYFDAPMDIVVDTDVFNGCIESAESEADAEQKLSLLKEACKLYSGDFLNKLSGDEWVLVESIQLKNKYSEALSRVCELLMELKDYDMVLELIEPACELYPFDEWQSVKMDCYIAMNRFKDAVKVYDDTAKMLIDELGVTPSKKMMDQFKGLSEHVSNRPQLIDDIKRGLAERPEEKGAFYCAYPGFRDVYRVVRRCMERTGQSIFLLVCTLVDTKGLPMERGDKLDDMSGELHEAIRVSLRRSDFFTRYNSSQYLVILMGTNEENCQLVIDRIKRNFSRVHKSWPTHLECSISSLYDMDDLIL